jgi:hypothetical protein
MVTATRLDAAVLAYPWSVLEQGAAVARRQVGEAVGFSLAAAYHSLRQLDPLSARPVREHPDAAVYWTPGDGAFARTSITPSVASGELHDSFSRARTELGSRGARVGAWVSVLHSTAAASAHPDSAVTIATGDVLRHALCPSSPDAGEYAVALIADLVAREAPDYLELEATGHLGWRHDSRHDKAAIPVSDAMNHLLSVCFCTACRSVMAGLGSDPELIREQFRLAIVRGLRAGGRTRADEPAEESLAVVDETRRRTAVALTGRLVAAAGGRPVLVHAGPEPRRTGARAALDASDLGEVPAPVDLVISSDGMDHLSCLDTIARAADHYAGAAGVVLSRRVQEPDVRSGAQLAADVSGAVARGARGVRFHTYGLLDEERLRWIRTAVEDVA